MGLGAAGSALGTEGAGGPIAVPEVWDFCNLLTLSSRQ